MQAAECPSLEAAQRLESELNALRSAYVSFSNFEHDDGAEGSPLLELGRRTGVPWYRANETRFHLKDPFEETVVMRIDRLVFFWGCGFDLGGPWLRQVMQALGATTCAAWPKLRIQCADPQARVAELTSFLRDEDFDEQFELTDDAARLSTALFSVSFERANTRQHLLFDDSGVQDWAFVSLLPQLDGENPTFLP